MAPITDFPPELLIQCFQHFPLPILIAARGVGKPWRELVDQTPIHPARRALLDLFLEIISDERYFRNKDRLAADAQSKIAGNPAATGTFDRRAFLDQLRAQTNYIPHEFLFWILEWPENVVIGRLWPSLPADPRPTAEEMNNATDAGKTLNYWGANVLGMGPPIVYTVIFDTPELPGLPILIPVPALQVWRKTSDDKILLILGDSDFFRKNGEVYSVGYGMEADIPLEVVVGGSHPYHMPHSWISFLRHYFQFGEQPLSSFNSSTFTADAELDVATTWVEWQKQSER